jgi:hypothetical protein
MSDNAKKVDLTPPSDEAAQAWFESLSDNDKQLVRNQQMINKLTNKKQDEEPAWGRLDDAEFLKQRLLKYGF